MKTAFVFLLAAVTMAKEITIKEGSAVFKEKVNLVNGGRCVEYETPDHNDRMGVKMMQCFNHKHQKAQYATGKHAPQFCLIMEDATKESVVSQYVDTLRLLKEGIDSSKKVIKDDRSYLPDLHRVVDEQEIDSNLREFCKGRDMVWANEEEDNAQAVTDALNQIIAEKGLDDRKRAVLKSFIACDASSTDAITNCAKADVLPYADCKVRTKYCTYRVNCPMDLMAGGFGCDPKHVMNSIFCCDFRC